MSKIDKKQHKKVIKIRYEKFFKNFKTESKNSVNYLGLIITLNINLI